MTTVTTSVESLKKAFLIGVGASVVTAEKIGDFVRDVVDDLVARGEMTSVDAKKLSEDLKKRAVNVQKQAKKEGGSLQKNVESAVKSAVRSLGLATQDDLKKLRGELGLKKAAPKQPLAKKAKKVEKAKKAKPKPLVSKSKKTAVKKAVSRKR